MFIKKCPRDPPMDERQKEHEWTEEGCDTGSNASSAGPTESSESRIALHLPKLILSFDFHIKSAFGCGLPWEGA